MRLQPLSRSQSRPFRPPRNPERLAYPAALSIPPTLGWILAGWPGLAGMALLVLAGIAGLALAAGR